MTRTNILRNGARLASRFRWQTAQGASFLGQTQVGAAALANAAFPSGHSLASPMHQQRSHTRPLSAQPAGGFSYPGPKKLEEIVKLPLLNMHGTSEVKQIWLDYHKDHKTAVADTLGPEEFEMLMQRSQRCPMFVLPVPRGSGYVTLVLQFQGKHCLFTSLEDFRANPGAATPYMTLAIFDDLVEKKGIALVRGEVANFLSREEALKLTLLLKQFYLGPRVLFDTVVNFNEASSKFDFAAVLRTAGIAG